MSFSCSHVGIYLSYTEVCMCGLVARAEDTGKWVRKGKGRKRKQKTHRRTSSTDTRTIWSNVYHAWATTQTGPATGACSEGGEGRGFN